MGVVQRVCCRETGGYGEKNMTLITDIQRYSIHDGDGIRTTVFFKGCPLRCVWCHNPETQRYQRELLFDREKCVGCGACVNACPNQAILLKQQKQNHSESIQADTDRALCTVCGKCTDFCNSNLREPAGKEYTLDGLFRELKKDEMFYEESGGGVTLSGGEVMTTDMDFLVKLVKKLHRFGISVFIDTCGQAPYENFERILPYTDTFLYDIKLLDSGQHEQYTGIGNERILENLENLSRAGARIYIRIPMIKEVNGNETFMKAVIAYLLEKKIHAAKVFLLPYHNTGSGKYAKTGRIYEGTEFHAPDAAELEHFKSMFREAGFQI